MHNEDGVRSPLFGICFTPVDGGKQMKLGDFKPVDGTFEAETDNIQVINPTTLGNLGFFTYLDKSTADEIATDPEGMAGEIGDLDWAIGWWDADIGMLEDDAQINDYPVNVGDGFMGYFEAENEISFGSAGKAPTVPTTITPNPIPEGGDTATRSPIFANYIPRDITLKYFTPIDGTFEAETDNIQVINPTTLGNLGFFTYLDKSTADEIATDPEGMAGEIGDLDWAIGWWDADIGMLEDDAQINDYPVPAGFGFMGYFEAGNEITFQLPSSTAKLD